MSDSLTAEWDAIVRDPTISDPARLLALLALLGANDVPAEQVPELWERIAAIKSEEDAQAFIDMMLEVE